MPKMLIWACATKGQSEWTQNATHGLVGVFFFFQFHEVSECSDSVE